MAKTMPSKKANVSASKAKTILSDGTVRGNPLTTKQKGLFGAIAGGAPTAAPTGPTSPMPPTPAPKGRPKQLAIGQRPMLGARTKAAMRGRR
jgi:hypothetical protein